jgi:mRNA interferase MazF
MRPEPRRGEVWLAALDKRRPVVVLTRDPMGQFLNAVVAAPVTTRVRGLSTEVPIGMESGITQPSVVNADNIELVARDDLLGRIGEVPSETLEMICRALAIAIDCDINA